MVLICGPKASGKSTFARILVNRFLTRAPAASAPFDHRDGVAFLDLDPGQPEFSMPGQLSLCHLRAPVFGPPFTHPIVPDRSKNRLVRAHAIAALSPQADPNHFESCANDLVRHHLKHRRSLPLVINYSSWLTAQGLVLLARLVGSLSPTHVVFTSEEGPAQILDYLNEPELKPRVKVLPARPTQGASRTPAQNRAMQSISYFHQRTVERGLLPWNASPVALAKPWVVSCGGVDPDVSGMLVLGRRVPPEHVWRVYDGSTVALVVADRDLDTGDNNSPLDPSRSWCVGHALVRAIDVKAQTLDLVTPADRQGLSRSALEDRKLVLVGGKTDAPSWAYLERQYEPRKDVPPEELPWVQTMFPGEVPAEER